MSERDRFHTEHETEVTIPPRGIVDDTSVAARAPSDVTAVPRQIDGYELLEEIARGGMGIVYRAHQQSLDRVVALKTVLAGRLASEEAIQLFRTEARAAGKLIHPGVVPVYDVGEYEGFHYFSMPLIDGASLGNRVARGPIDPDEAAAFMQTVAETIQFAHEQHVVHRDLKPGNILVDAHQQPLVTDFGMAGIIDDSHTPDDVAELAGTAEYMSPEQASGESTGPLTDVYSLGATLYCLLTGRPPFQSHKTLDTLMAVLRSEPVPPSRLNERVPRDLELICLKCMAKRPLDRYQSAHELAEELKRFLDGDPVIVHPVGAVGRFVRWMRREPKSAVIAAGFVISFTAALVISVYYNIQLNMQRNIALHEQHYAEYSEERAVRLQKVTQTLLRDLASAENGILQALQYVSLGKMCSAATKLLRVTQPDELGRAFKVFQTARTGLSESHQEQLLVPLERIVDEIKSGADSGAISEAVEVLTVKTRRLWLASTEQSPQLRQQIRLVLYSRTFQLVDQITAAYDRYEVEQAIEVLLDLVNAELFVVATDDVYLEADKLLVTFQQWDGGPPPESLKTIAAELQQHLENPEPNSE